MLEQTKIKIAELNKLGLTVETNAINTAQYKTPQYYAQIVSYEDVVNPVPPFNITKGRMILSTSEHCSDWFDEYIANVDINYIKQKLEKERTSIELRKRRNKR